MNVRCPNCQTVFRVDPARVPAAGIRARCARCSDTFRVSRSGAETQDATANTSGFPARTGPHPAGGPGAASPQPGAAQPSATAASAPGVAAPTPPRAPAQAAPTPPGTAAAASSPAAPTGADPGTQPRTPFFGSRDPQARAQRIARALVSDIVAYHPTRRDASLEAGSLRADFREEIMKSWEEYVAQVGLDMAKSTPYFRNSLNEILARGQQLF
jgi:predicted Zn finger-like uncharacterized protein